MKVELEDHDIEAIAQRVAELVRPLTSIKEQKKEDKIFDVNELAEYLGVKKKWIYERKRFNEIPAFKVKGKLKFSKAEIDEWLATNKVPVVPK